MGRIKTKQFQILTDVEMAWKFIVDVYDAISDKGRENVEAPFFEYALTSTWMNIQRHKQHLLKRQKKEDINCVIKKGNIDSTSQHQH